MEKQRHLAVIILTTVCLTYFVVNFLRNAASALTPVLITELGITRGAMGLLITGYFLIYGIMQLPAGILADVLGPRKSIIWFMALTFIGGTLFWLSYIYELLLAAQIIIGIGTSIFYINAITAITRWFPSNRKATAIGILSASGGLGGFASYMGFPLATSIWGNWRDLYLIMLIVLFANWAMNIFVLKDSPTPLNDVKKETPDIIASIKKILTNRRFIPIILGYTLLCFNYVLFQWGNQFLIESKGLVYIEAGLVTSLGTVAGVIGCFIMGMLSDKLRQRRTPLIVFFGLFLLALVGLIMIPAGLPVALYIGLWCLMIFGNSVWVLFFSMVGEVLPRKIAGIGLGLMNGLGLIFSGIMTPIYGSLVDTTGSFLIPSIISIGIASTTFLILIFLTKETYGSTVNE